MIFDYVDTCGILIICNMFLNVLKVTYYGMHGTQGRAVFNFFVNEFTRIYDMEISFNVIFPYGLKHFNKRFCSFFLSFFCLFVFCHILFIIILKIYMSISQTL